MDDLDGPGRTNRRAAGDDLHDGRGPVGGPLPDGHVGRCARAADCARHFNLGLCVSVVPTSRKNDDDA